MPRQTVMPGTLSPEAKRFYRVFIDQGGNQVAFARDLKVSQSTVSRILSGERPLTENVIRPICYKWGYSSEWLLLGKGNKKAKIDKANLITEISMLRTEIDILANRLEAMAARMKAYEQKKVG